MILFSFDLFGAEMFSNPNAQDKKNERLFLSCASSGANVHRHPLRDKRGAPETVVITTFITFLRGKNTGLSKMSADNKTELMITMLMMIIIMMTIMMKVTSDGSENALFYSDHNVHKCWVKCWGKCSKSFHDFGLTLLGFGDVFAGFCVGIHTVCPGIISGWVGFLKFAD